MKRYILSWSYSDAGHLTHTHEFDNENEWRKAVAALRNEGAIIHESVAVERASDE